MKLKEFLNTDNGVTFAIALANTNPAVYVAEQDGELLFQQEPTQTVGTEQEAAALLKQLKKLQQRAMTGVTNQHYDAVSYGRRKAAAAAQEQMATLGKLFVIVKV